MTYRPYPSVDRARHQLDRHVHHVDAPVVTMTPASARALGELVRVFQPTAARAVANAHATLRLMPSSRDLFPAAPPAPVETP